MVYLVKECLLSLKIMIFVEDERLKLNGNGAVSLSAVGKISIKARNIRMNSKDEIVYVSE